MDKTQIIAGQEITLTEGVRYLAGRPFSEKSRTVYPVTVSEIQPASLGENAQPPVAVLTVDNLSYDEANAFLLEFNNEGISFSGRVW